MTRILPLIIFLVFAAMATLLLVQKEQEKKPSHAVQAALPKLDLYALSDASKPFTLGSGVSVLNFFASWCAPCLTEHPQLIALKKKFPKISMNGVAWNEKKENIDAMMEEHGNPYDHIWNDADGRSSIALGLRGIPETYIVKDGVIIYHLSGPITQDIRTAEIEPLLEKK